MKLPLEFLDKMKKLLGEVEFNQLIDSYSQPRNYGLRVNTLKINVDDFLKISPFELQSVPWTSDGFYYPEGLNPGRHPYYHAGLYYIQEPSAMLPGQILEAEPGEKVLDLCAAPGGKTVQIAAGMKGEGLLVANDINQDRVKALVKNIELCGVQNAIVLNEKPSKLAANFEEYFDKILVDAPCSGEGMFRKDEDAAKSWESFKCDTCAGMQKDILMHVDKMLKPGGILVYSTCTFSPEEDEKMITYFLDLHKEYEVMEIPKCGGIADGRPEWSDGNPVLAKTARLWPHKMKGEGHFVAKLKKGNHESINKNEFTKNRGFLSYNELPEEFHRFVNDNLKIKLNGCFILKGKNLYMLPESHPNLDNLKVAKFGWFLGELQNGRFEASHSMIIAMKKDEVKRIVDFSSNSREAISYLKGETLMDESEKGLTAICIDGYTVGWAKQTGDMLKNLYPKGWRKMS